MNWCATTPRPPGPLSRHQKYFLQSLGCGKKPSSSHLKSVEGSKPKAASEASDRVQHLITKYLQSSPVPGSGVVGGSGVVSLLLKDSAESSLRFPCLLRFRLLARIFGLLLGLFLGLSPLSEVLTALLLLESSSSSEEGSKDLLSTSWSSSSSSSLLLDLENVLNLGRGVDPRFFGAGVVVLLPAEPNFLFTASL